jgi:hypothetical protein
MGHLAQVTWPDLPGGYELALAGVGVTVIDKLASPPTPSKTVGVPVRATEMLEQPRLADVYQHRSGDGFTVPIPQRAVCPG